MAWPKNYTKLLYHIIFATRPRRSWIRSEIRPRFYQYVGGFIRGLGGRGLEIGGIEDHIHVLASLPPTIAVSDFIGKMKANSSKWIEELVKLLKAHGITPD